MFFSMVLHGRLRWGAAWVMGPMRHDRGLGARLLCCLVNGMVLIFLKINVFFDNLNPDWSLKKCFF